MDVLVIGAGVSGLTSALRLAESGHSVRVVAAEPSRRTTSVVAGAMWGPSFQQPLDQTLAWTATSLRVFGELARRPGSGVREVTCLSVGEMPPGAELPPQVTMIPDLRPCPPDRLPSAYPSGYLGTMPVVDMPTYLDHLGGRLAALGVETEIRRVDALPEVLGAADVVVNCAGVGAATLVGDAEVRPVRGQHVVLTNPGVEGAFMELTSDTEWTSYVAHPTRVVCGGSSAPDVWDTTPDDALTARIVDRVRELEPTLATARVTDVLVGLRPDRPTVRVEAERVAGTVVVHNYGHGGSGVSLSWGCAEAVLSLATARTADTRPPAG